MRETSEFLTRLKARIESEHLSLDYAVLNPSAAIVDLASLRGRPIGAIERRLNASMGNATFFTEESIYRATREQYFPWLSDLAMSLLHERLLIWQDWDAKPFAMIRATKTLRMKVAVFIAAEMANWGIVHWMLNFDQQGVFALLDLPSTMPDSLFRNICYSLQSSEQEFNYVPARLLSQEQYCYYVAAYSPNTADAILAKQSHRILIFYP